MNELIKTCISKTHKILQSNRKIPPYRVLYNKWIENSPISGLRMWRRISKLDCKISQRAQSAVKRKNPTPSVGNRIEHFFRILTSALLVFYLYLLFFNLFISRCVPGCSNFVFRILVFRRSGIPAFLQFCTLIDHRNDNNILKTQVKSSFEHFYVISRSWPISAREIDQLLEKILKNWCVKMRGISTLQ